MNLASRPTLWALAAAVSMAGWALGGPDLAVPDYGTLPIDVVALAGGNELKGDEAFAVDHEGYRYLFVNAENAEKFRKDPAKFEIGMDGMCASMGPLAGRGSLDIVAVYSGRAYLCASDSCRTDFLATPGKHMDIDDPAPQVRDQNDAVGREKIKRAIKAHFGDAGIEAVDVFEQQISSDVPSGDKTIHHVETLAIGADGSVRSQDAWDDAVYAFVATPTTAWSESKGDPAEPMFRDARRELERRVRDVHWVSVLRNATSPDATVVALPPAKLFGGPTWIDRVAVSRHGITCILGLEQSSGRIHCVDFTVRGKDHLFAPRTRVFESYEIVDGAVVPTAWTDYASGQQIGAQTGAVVRINESVVDNPFTIRAD